MFAYRTSDTPTKNLENINFHFEHFKARFHLPVLPPSMKTRANSKVAHFCFDTIQASCHKFNPVVKGQVQAFGTILLLLIRQHTISRRRRSHRAFKSMCVALSDDGVSEVLCLFQSKINNELAAAIDGLNQAAKELAVRLWCQKPFLFIVFALGCPPDASLTASHHPIVFVHRQNLHEYFTATLAPAAELCWIRHQKTCLSGTQMTACSKGKVQE